MLRLLAPLALLGCAAGSVVSRSVPTGAVAPASTAPVGRRTAVAAACGAFAALCAERVNAYDAIPQIEPDFAAMELQREERLAKSRKKTAELRAKLKVMQEAKTGSVFIEAADDMALWVIGEGSVPEGIKMKPFVADLKEAFEALPKKSYACEMTRTNKGICYTPGKDVELAFEALLKELRTYSKIQLGDYRKVEFNAF